MIDGTVGVWHGTAVNNNRKIIWIYEYYIK